MPPVTTGSGTARRAPAAGAVAPGKPRRRAARVAAVFGRLDPQPVRRRELGLAVLALGLLGVLAYGRHVVEGGLYNDDWNFGAQADLIGFAAHYDFLATSLPQRPLYALYQTGTYELFGLDPALLNGWSLLVAVLGSAALFAVQRALAVPWPLAFAAAALMLLFPWSDALRLWPTAANGGTAILLFLIGVAVALAAFRRGSAVLHVVSVACYLAAILLYESVLGGMVGVVCVYLVVARPRPALVRWGVDLAVLVVAVVLFTSQSTYQQVPLGDAVDNLWRFLDQGLTILTWALVPFAELPRWLVLGAALVVLAAGGAIAARAPADDPIRRRMTTSIAMVGFGGLVIACAYVVFATSSPSDYAPLYEGAQNRVNGFAGVGYALVIVGVWSSAAWLLLRLPTPAAPRLATGAALVAVLAVAIAWAVKVDGHREFYDASWARQEQVLASIERAVPDPAPGTTILTFGHPMNEAFGVPVIGGPEDLKWALRSRYDDITLTGHGVFEASTIACGARGARLEGNGFRPVVAPYGRTVFVDTSSSRAAPITSRAACERANTTFPRGPTWQPQG